LHRQQSPLHGSFELERVSSSSASRPLHTLTDIQVSSSPAAVPAPRSLVSLSSDSTVRPNQVNTQRLCMESRKKHAIGQSADKVPNVSPSSVACARAHTHTHTHTHTQKQIGKTYLDFTETRDSEWQWNQLGHMQVCTLLQSDNHASQYPTTQFFTSQMLFLMPNQQCQSTEGIIATH